MKLKLFTTTSQQHDLHLAHDATKRTSKTVKVDRAALINILMDHANLVHALGEANLEYHE